jgi:hypothetical protein
MKLFQSKPASGTLTQGSRKRQRLAHPPASLFPAASSLGWMMERRWRSQSAAIKVQNRT